MQYANYLDKTVLFNISIDSKLHGNNSSVKIQNISYP